MMMMMMMSDDDNALPISVDSRSIDRSQLPISIATRRQRERDANIPLRRTFEVPRRAPIGWLLMLPLAAAAAEGDDDVVGHLGIVL